MVAMGLLLRRHRRVHVAKPGVLDHEAALNAADTAGVAPMTPKMPQDRIGTPAALPHPGSPSHEPMARHQVLRPIAAPTWVIPDPDDKTVPPLLSAGVLDDSELIIEAPLRSAADPPSGRAPAILANQPVDREPMDHFAVAAADTLPPPRSVTRPDEPFSVEAPAKRRHRPFVLDISDGSHVSVQGSAVLGRRPQLRRGANQLVRLSDPSGELSKSHLIVGHEEDDFWLVDLGSTNGTWVHRADGGLIECHPARRVKISAGDVVEIGDLRICPRRVSKEAGNAQ